MKRKVVICKVGVLCSIGLSLFLFSCDRSDPIIELAALESEVLFGLHDTTGTSLDSTQRLLKSNTTLIAPAGREIYIDTGGPAGYKYTQSSGRYEATTVEPGKIIVTWSYLNADLDFEVSNIFVTFLDAYPNVKHGLTSQTFVPSRTGGVISVSYFVEAFSKAKTDTLFLQTRTYKTLRISNLRP